MPKKELKKSKYKISDEMIFFNFKSENEKYPLMSSSYGNKLARAIISTKCTLKPCKKIRVSFNPWQAETKSIRDFYHYVFSPSMRMSNDQCKIQVDIRSDKDEPKLEIEFNDNSKLLFKTKTLTTYDIVREFEYYGRIKLPKEETQLKKSCKISCLVHIDNYYH
ncbi:39S ribosomal mitochondrial [Brachionus plicatilis]|uniref:Large ribosomal subunit protein mL53 n=1 Tax=Brachionus plicatilis TaxID=10195 RepID=A0A3M7RBZ0_BRAPC|nr:39S ribosomal mitochondrial [Brachionus plicatilis]